MSSSASVSSSALVPSTASTSSTKPSQWSKHTPKVISSALSYIETLYHAH
eukprot:CAMPEP_0184993778 /NCGR_PEP_ID=MMETSP1098-20130426/46766_1 /TAXON_ID=89044 /ORGANISM="Spumella elongata, Strain CCAP 955/1" /LENGTH=49 /DNA_ID= /DNA_START= /DNA_END= /DNA_ORIENTATION=